MNNVIEIDSLSKMYGKARGVKQLSLSVKRGEIFGFIGPNGAGKSTTTRTILGFLKPTSGSARIFGFDTVTQSPEIHRKVGYLPADVNFYDSMTAQELLDFSACLHRGRGCRAHQAAQRTSGPGSEQEISFPLDR